ncbi:MAG: chorismate mutase [Solirubrobacterales bacterium]
MTAVDPSSHRLWAVRGATTVAANDRDQVLEATSELLGELISANELQPERIVSAIFTCTEGLDAEFPAVAARRLGFNTVPLLCTREIDVPGSLANVIRAMIHFYGDPGLEPRHVYLREARSLRSDLAAPQ